MRTLLKRLAFLLLATIALLAPLHAATQINIDPSGNDAADCSPLTPCATLQHAADLCMDLTTCVVNVNSGSYQGATFYGINVLIVGAGSSTTSIVGTGALSTNCSAIVARKVGYLQVSGLRLSSTCPGGSDLYAQAIATISVGLDMWFDAAPIAHLYAQDGGTILTNYNYKMSGNGAYGWLVAHGDIRMFGGPAVTVTMSGGPVFSAAVFDGILGGTIKTGGVTFSGATYGIRYLLAQGSSIDTEQVTTQLPGDQQGYVTQAAYYVGSPPCIAGLAGCWSGLPAPGGIGTGGNVTVSGGDYGGKITISTGSNPGSFGYLFVLPQSRMTDCTANINLTGASWPLSNITTNTASSGGHFYNEIAWWSATPLMPWQTYVLNYACN